MLQADRNLIDKIRRDESTGEVMSLVGKLEGSRMGDLAKRTKPPTAAQIEPKTKRKKDDVIMTSSTFEKLKSGALSSAGEEELSAVYYRPKTIAVSYTHLRGPRDRQKSRMPSSA